jgi:predicted RNA-binding protein YlxR (DUF448 family)
VNELRGGGPVRQCAGCRQRVRSSRLLRLVAGPRGEVVADPFRRLPGRGAHVCPRATCIRAALDRGAVGRVLKDQVSFNVTTLTESAAAGFQKKAEGLLGLARRSGNMRAGMDDVSRGLATQHVRVVILATDTSDRTRTEITTRAGHVGVSVLSGGVAKESLGHLVGREDTAVLGLTDAQQAEELVFLHQAVMELLAVAGSGRSKDAPGGVTAVESQQRQA